MVSVEEASGIIGSHPFLKETTPVSLEAAVGQVLGEDVYADRPFPPFDRVAMDGIAIRAESFVENKTFRIAATQAAGEPAKRLEDISECIEVMTGAMLPDGTDAVIRYEDLDIAGSVAKVNLPIVNPGQNVHRKGSDAREGAVLLTPGKVLSPAEIALLAAVGKARVNVYRFPSAAVISGGNELVDVHATPLAHEIRRSNTYAIKAAMDQMGWKADLYHFPDEEAALREGVTSLLQRYEVLIFSGGVSKGKFDFIPRVLDACGVRCKFHQVSQRPGKPFWFGVSDAGKHVFALPGNPVSTYMCFYRYVRPWIMESFGVKGNPTYAVLAEDVHFPPPLTYFLQVRVDNDRGILRAIPSPGGGSGDFANLADVTGFLELPARRTAFKKDETFPYLPFRY